jgi:hypothetical protein
MHKKNLKSGDQDKLEPGKFSEGATSFNNGKSTKSSMYFPLMEHQKPTQGWQVGWGGSF